MELAAESLEERRDASRHRADPGYCPGQSATLIPRSSPSPARQLFFIANDGAVGRELWSLRSFVGGDSVGRRRADSLARSYIIPVSRLGICLRGDDHPYPAGSRRSSAHRPAGFDRPCFRNEGGRSRHLGSPRSPPPRILSPFATRKLNGPRRSSHHSRSTTGMGAPGCENQVVRSMQPPSELSLTPATSRSGRY